MKQKAKKATAVKVKVGKLPPVDLKNRAVRATAASLEDTVHAAGFTLPPGALDLLLAWILSQINKPKPTEPTVPTPPPPPPPNPSVPAPVLTGGPVRRITGGTAKVTGIQEGKGARWKDDEIVPNSVRSWEELDDARVDEICAGTANAPQVCRIMTDCTFTDQNGKAFGPNDPSWVNDHQPGSVEDPGAEPARLVWDDDTEQIYLTHEYLDYGNRCWIRCSVTPGTGADIRGPRYVGPRYPDTGIFASVPLSRKGKAIDVIHVGRH